MTIQELQTLIAETHNRGVKLAQEIRTLEHKRPFDWRIRVSAKKSLLKGLEVLNARRRKELEKLEHAHPQPKPSPKPAPQPTPKPQPKPAPKPPAKRFTMYDTTNASTGLPTRNPEAVAGYVGGFWASFKGLVARYPKAKHVSIAVNASEEADVLDVENGDATPAQAPGWVRKRHARGVKRPGVYANLSTMPAVIDALTKDDIKRDEYVLWVADYDDIAEIPDGYDAKQYKNVEAPGHNYDVSLCEPWFTF